MVLEIIVDMLIILIFRLFLTLINKALKHNSKNCYIKVKVALKVLNLILKQQKRTPHHRKIKSSLLNQ